MPEPSSNQILLTYLYLSEQFQKIQFELGDPVQRPKIHHFLAMVMDNEILEAQGRGSFMGLPRPFFLKSTLFTKSGHGKPLKQPRP